MSRLHTESTTLVKPRIKPYKKPSYWLVILHNDDVTTMEFVISLLMTVFGKSEADATEIMLKVHHEGSGIAGRYSRDLAETKMCKAIEIARAEGFPLKVTIKEES